MTTATTTASPIAQPLSEVDPVVAKAMLDRREGVLVDVREPDEHMRERIAGSVLMPLSTLTPAKIAALGATRVLVHCKSGRRSADAASRCASLASSGVSITSVHGGIEAWKAAGLPTVVDTARPKWSVMQQTQVAIGTGVLAGTALGYLVHPGFLAIPAFMGAGLIVAGSTGTCGMEVMIARLPWNRPSACAAGSCST
jgi:rhodanese-related sulfurtransferase